MYKYNIFDLYLCMFFEKIVLNGLPKVSLNRWYSSSHWSQRTKLKNDYKLLIRSQLGRNFVPFTKDAEYETEYNFYFRIKPHDCTNNVAMVKLIEDVIFEDDAYSIIKSVKITSEKAKRDYVEIKINQL